MDKVNLPYSIIPSGRSWRDKKMKNKKEKHKRKQEDRKDKESEDDDHIIDRRA